jgi:hypothetical protein
MSDKPDKPLWEIDEAKSADHWLELNDPKGWRSAIAKWDGCVHYYRYFNTPRGMDTKNDEEEGDYLHICNIDEEIARLQALKRIAANYFVERGKDEFWQPETIDGSVQPVLQIEGTSLAGASTSEAIAIGDNGTVVSANQYQSIGTKREEIV